MKPRILALICLLVSTPAYSQQPLVNVTARYEGFDLSKYTDFKWPTRKKKGLLTEPQADLRSGEAGKLQIVREIPLPKSPTGESRTYAGVTLELLPIIKNDYIRISGKSIVRRTSHQTTPQPIQSVSFATLETYFNCAVKNGDQVILPIGGDSKDKARIILEVRLIDTSGQPVRDEKNLPSYTGNKTK